MKTCSHILSGRSIVFFDIDYVQVVFTVLIVWSFIDFDEEGSVEAYRSVISCCVLLCFFFIYAGLFLFSLMAVLRFDERLNFKSDL